MNEYGCIPKYKNVGYSHSYASEEDNHCILVEYFPFTQKFGQHHYNHYNYHWLGLL